MRALWLMLLCCLLPLPGLATPTFHGRAAFEGPRAEPGLVDLRWLWRHRVLRLGVLGNDQPPLDILGTGRAYEGITADYAGLVAEYLNLDMQVQVFNGFETAVAALREGTIDLLGSVTTQQALQAGLRLSSAYAEDHPLLLAQDLKSSIQRGTSLRLVMVDGYRPVDQVSQFYPQAQLQVHPTPFSALAALTLGKADLYLGNALVARYVQGRSQLGGVEEIGHAALPRQGIGFAMLDNGSPLPRLVDAALDGIRDVERTRISERWRPLAGSARATQSVQLSDAQQRWLNDNPRVRVLVDDQVLPLSYRDSKGELRGLTLDVLQLITRRTGLEFDVQAGAGVEQMIEQVTHGKAQLIAGLPYSARLEQRLGFSRAYLSASRVLVSRKGAKAPDSLEQLDGRWVALVWGSAMVEVLQQRYPQVRQLLLPGPLHALRAVADGKVDAALLTLDDARPLVARWYPGTLQISASLALPPAHFALAGVRGASELLGIIDSVLLSLTPRETDALVRRWRNPMIVPDGVWSRHRSKILFGFGIVFGLLLLAFQWIRYLRRRQVRLRRAKRAADAANQAKTEFLATISHEIRTPLHAVLGMLELAQRKAAQGILDRLALEVATDAARGLKELIGDILDITRIETGHLQLAPQRVRLRELVSRVVQLFEQQARGKGLDLQMQMSGVVDTEVMLDPLRFKQVLANLLSNAIKFTARGQIVVSLQAMPDEGLMNVALQVKDSGVGIAASELASLGQRFRQASNHRQSPRASAGLGLSISRSLCQLMGGELRLRSTLGQGTEAHVQLKLPLLPSEVAAPESLPLLPAQGGPRLRVLVVDDYPANRLLLAQQLDYLGHQARVAEDGAQALRLWLKEHFDVVISDCNMPRLDGHGLARAIREHERRSARPRCRLIGLTASAQESERLRSCEAGMDDCLFKPLDLDSLIRALMSAQPTLTQEEDGAMLCLAHLRHLVGNDEAALKALLADLRASNREDLQRLEGVGDDPTSIAELAHRVKGGARIARAEALVALCEQVERCCRAEPLERLALGLAVRAMGDGMRRLERQLERQAGQNASAHIMPSNNSTNRITSTTPTIPEGP
ncbi:ATP-binding protein [Pseudomonas sp. KU43P]|uniref:ATP-binding protein n=1 Tax=Pseudomonas sp. KU43P TaxID=2487887 RepID=UPI0012AA3BDE|nr:transporter substrate-binding domain-containing protein [Pseudomonas sp. KU43P]BBH47519.1 two-component system sensor histidine kinase/response regulator [Pseudomonas sp. KU43P]